MTKIAIVVVVIAMVYCIQALPRPQFNPWGHWNNGFPNIHDQMNQIFSRVSSNIANSQNGMMPMPRGNGQMTSFSSVSSSNGGSGNHEAVFTRTVQRSGQPAQTEVIHEVNGKVEKYNLTDSTSRK